MPGEKKSTTEMSQVMLNQHFKRHATPAEREENDAKKSRAELKAYREEWALSKGIAVADVNKTIKNTDTREKSDVMEGVYMPDDCIYREECAMTIPATGEWNEKSKGAIRARNLINMCKQRGPPFLQYNAATQDYEYMRAQRLTFDTHKTCKVKSLSGIVEVNEDDVQDLLNANATFEANVEEKPSASLVKADSWHGSDAGSSQPRTPAESVSSLATPARAPSLESQSARSLATPPPPTPLAIENKKPKAKESKSKEKEDFSKICEGYKALMKACGCCCRCYRRRHHRSRHRRRRRRCCCS